MVNYNRGDAYSKQFEVALSTLVTCVDNSKIPVLTVTKTANFEERQTDETSQPAEKLGAPRGIRTPDLLIRSQTLYPTELWARVLLYSP